MLYINGWSWWTPPAENPGAAPALEYVSPLLKRRLSQLTRMTVEVVHDVLPAAPESGLVFVSSCGESRRQLQVDAMLIQEGTILPAAFSLSVFNASPAVAAIALGITAGYTALFPAANQFQEGFLYGVAPVLSGEAESVILVYGDQLLPSEYEGIADPADMAAPYAAAFVLSSVNRGGIPVEIYPEKDDAVEMVPWKSAGDLVEYLKQEGNRG